MKPMRIWVFGATLLLASVFSGGSAFADKSGATLEAPDQVLKGSEVTVKVHVTHNSNSFLHYTSWVRVKANGEEIKKWEYSVDHRPEGSNFTKEFRLVISGPTELEAEANCTLHGSKGPGLKTINIAPPR
jgi:desulfoferrodoxin (superoxide reductase-like protein)